MRNRKLTCLVNRRPSAWTPDWPFFVLDGARVPHDETEVEARIRFVLQTDSAQYRHIMPLLLSADRREWSRHVTAAEDDYRPEWKTHDVATWTDSTFRALGGKSTFPPKQDTLPLYTSASFARVRGGLAMTMGSVTKVLQSSFVGATASVESDVLHGRIILSSGTWDVGAGTQASVTFSPASYPWRHVAETLAGIPRIEEFLLEAGTLAHWHASHSPMDKVGCVVTGLIIKGLRLS